MTQPLTTIGCSALTAWSHHLPFSQRSHMNLAKHQSDHWSTEPRLSQICQQPLPRGTCVLVVRCWGRDGIKSSVRWVMFQNCETYFRKKVPSVIWKELGSSIEMLSFSSFSLTNRLKCLVFRIEASKFHQWFFDFINSREISETNRKAKVDHHGDLQIIFWTHLGPVFVNCLNLLRYLYDTSVLIGWKNKASLLHSLIDFVDILSS